MFYVYQYIFHPNNIRYRTIHGIPQGINIPLSNQLVNHSFSPYFGLTSFPKEEKKQLQNNWDIFNDFQILICVFFLKKILPQNIWGKE